MNVNDFGSFTCVNILWVQDIKANKPAKIILLQT